MPAGFTIKGIAPFELQTYPDAVKLLYWTWVVDLALKSKDDDLAAGLDKDGEPLLPISEYTRKHRKSAMTPDGKGSPFAPPLSPGGPLSRVRSLLAGRALVDRAEFWWRFDPFTHASFSKILTYQQEQGRDVFGLSDASVESVRLRALGNWRAWLRNGAVVPMELEGKRVVAPLAATGTTGPAPVQPLPAQLPGRAPTKNAVFGIGAPPQGRPIRGFTEKEFKAHFRMTAPANVQSRPGQAYNRILSHVWGHPGQGRSPGGVAPLVPTPKRPPPLRVATPMPVKPRPTAKPIAPVPAVAKVSESVPRPKAKLAASYAAANYLRNEVSGDIGGVVQHVINDIDSLHTIPRNALPIPIKEATGPSYNAGQLSITQGTTGELTPTEIVIRTDKSLHPSMTTAHEIGHFVDYVAIPGGQSPNRDHKNEPIFAAWTKAVIESPEVQTLRRVRKDTLAQGEMRPVGQRGTNLQPRQDYADYLLQSDELWARSYAQWVATRSQNPQMKKELEKDIKFSRGHKLPTQWQHDEFKPIAEAIDGIFRTLGLLKE